MEMAHVDVGAALAVEAWAVGRFRGLALETRNQTPCVSAEGPAGERVSVSCAEELFAMMALANAALPVSDARRITRPLVDAVRGQADALDAQIQALRRGAQRLTRQLKDEGELLAREAEALRPTLAALRQIAAVLTALLPQPTSS